MSIGDTETGSNAGEPEISGNPEEDSRKSVLEAFNYARNKFIQEIGTKPAEQLSEQEKEDLGTLNGAFFTDEHRQGVDFSHQKFTYTNKITDPNGGPDITQEEGVPVEGLISFLETKLMGLGDGSEKEKVQQTLDILKKKSQTYEEAFPNQKIDIQPGEVDNPVMFARKRQEAKFVSQDQRATGNDEGDYDKGLKTLRKRRMLIVPPKEVQATPVAEPITKAPTEPENPIDGRNLDNMGDADEADDEFAYPPPAGGGTTPPDTSGEIPNDKDLTSVLEPEDEEDETPEPSPEPAATGAAPSPDVATPEKIVLEGELIGADALINKVSNLEGIRKTNEFLHSGKWWQIWKWPSKISIRLGQGGAINWASERLRAAKTEHNTHLVGLLGSVTPAQLAEAKSKAASERADIVGRFKEGGATLAEKRVLANPEITKMIREQVIMPIVRGTITDEDKIRKVLADFVLKNLNNPTVGAEIRNLFGPDQSDYGTLTSYFATDLLKMGETVREGLHNQSVSLDQYDAYVESHYDLKIHLGKAAGPFNEDIRTTTDRAVAWCRRRQNESLARGSRTAGWLAGTVFNPLTVGIATSLAAEGVLRSIGVGSKVLTVSTFGLGLAAGMGVSAYRRTIEIGRDYKTHGAERTIGGQVETAAEIRQRIQNEGGWKGILLRIPKMDRLMGLYRRSDLEQLRLDSASTNQLLKGGGQEICADGGTRRSAYDILFLLRDPIHSTDTNLQKEAVRRMTEINFRINEGQSKDRDLINYSNKDSISKELRELQSISKQLRTALGATGIDLSVLETPASQNWMVALDADADQKKKELRTYTTKQAIGSAAFTGTVGAAGGAAVGAIKNISEGKNPFELFGGGRAPGLAVDQTKELFNNPANLQLNKDVILAVSPDAPNYAGRAASLLDANGNKIDTPPVHLASNGNIIVSGDFNHLPDSVKVLASSPGWENHPTNSLDFNIREDIKDMVATGRHDTFTHGDFVIDVNSGPNGQMSMEISGQPDTRLNGFFHIDAASGEPVLDIDSAFAENKQIDPAHFKDLTDKLAKDGWIVNHETVPGEPGLPVKEEFAKHSVNVDHREGYSYDQPGSQGNELGLHDSKAGKIVTLDMSHMQLGYQNGLNPNPIDVAQIIKNHEAGWYFTLPSAPQDGIWVSDGVDGNWDGKLLLNPDDHDPNHIIQTSQDPIQLGEFSKMVINQDALQKYPDGNLGTESFSRQDVFNLGENGKYGFIESGRIIQKDGVNVLQHFATIRGLGDAPPPLPTPPHDLYHLVPPGAIEIVPPPLVELTPPPIIPIPFAPRHPLGPLKKTEEPPIEYGEYGEPYGESSEYAEYGESLSYGELTPLLPPKILSESERTKLEKENTPEVLIKERINDQQNYLERLSQNYVLESPDPVIQRTLYRLNGSTENYMTELERVNKSLPPMSENTKLTVVIPARNEEGKIEQTLRGWVNQKAIDGKQINPEEVEFLVIVNRPNTSDTFDKTIAVINNLRNDPAFAGFKIHTVQKTFNFPNTDTTVIGNDGKPIKVPKGVRMGLIYKYGADLAILRNLARKDELRKANHLIRTGGADVYSRNPNFLSHVFNWFDMQPQLEQYVSRSDYPPAIYKKLPLLHFAQRLNEMMNVQFTNKKSNLGLGTYRAGIYAASGGFSPGLEVKEEIDLSQKMRQIIKTKEQSGTVARKRDTVINALDDPRRAVATILRGVSTVNQYDNWVNDAVRKINVGEVLKQPVPIEAQLTAENVQKQVESIFQFYFRQILASPTPPGLSREAQVKRASGLANQYMHRSLKILGVDNFEIGYKGDLATDVSSSDKIISKNFFVKIDNISKLQDLVNKYPQREKPEWMEKNPAPAPTLAMAPVSNQRTQQTLARYESQVNNIANFLDRRENLKQLGGKINTLTRELGATVGTTVGNRTRVVGELIPGISQYINSSKAAMGTNIQGLQVGGRITELENRLKTLATEAKTATGTRSQALMTEIQNTFSEYQQKVQVAIENRIQSAPAPAYEIVPPGEGNRILSQTEIHGQPYHGKSLTTEDLKNLDLIPTYKTTVEEADFWFSPPYFSDNEGRVAVVGYVKDRNGKMVARTFYRSNSQGVWRYLPNYRLDTAGNIDWYSKGYGEESIQLPIELQKSLAEITKDKTKTFNISDQTLVFAGTARNHTTPGTLYLEVNATKRELAGNFSESNPKKKIPPEKIMFTDQKDAPNFSKALSSWTQETDLYGPITVEVFASRSNELKYMFCRDSKNRVWIGGIENKSPIQSVGLRRDWITAGDLTTPAYEYSSQTAGYGNTADVKSGYVDMFENYLSKIPIIQEYLRSKNPTP